MLIFIQIVTMAVMIGLTYLVFQSFGAPRETLLYTADEKRQWDDLIGKKLGSWFTATNIVGTLTSLATVYVFFIGSSKLFGPWIFLCSVTIWGGSLVTNYFTRKITDDPKIKSRLADPDQVGGVIASVFWRNTDAARRTAAIVKWVSLLNIAGVIWLEFALFADIAGRLLGVQSIAWNVVVLMSCAVTVLYFTLKYGLRGFVFADLFHSPIIALSALLLLGGGAALFNIDPTLRIPFAAMMKPILGTKECILFAFHVLFLNLFLVLVTEGHWLRLWIFRSKETALQVKSTGFTAVLWALLIMVGFMASTLSPGAVGPDAIAGLLNALYGITPAFAAVFWMGGIAALFSTADSQIYSFLLVNEFDAKTGELGIRRMSSLRPLLSASTVALLFGAMYAGVRLLNLPLEKIVFIIIPMSLNIFPAFVRAARGFNQRPGYIVVSVMLYLICSILGLRQPDQQFTWTLVAAVMPIIVGGVASVERMDGMAEKA